MTTNSLSSLNSNSLVTHLKSLVAKEKALTLEIIDYLAEVSRRRLYLPKHTSLFGFMVDELGYCPSLAQLRLNSLKALQTIPEVREKVLNNQISLNSLAKAQSFINKENKELKMQAASPLTTDDQRELFSAIENVPAKKIEETLQTKRHELEVQKAITLNLPIPPIKPAKTKIIIEADSELVQFIDELKSLLSHGNPEGDLSTNLKKALPLAIRELKIAKGLIKRSEAINGLQETPAKNPTASTNNISTVNTRSTSSMKFKLTTRQKLNTMTRAIPTSIKREVWKRDQGCCQFIDPKTKAPCRSRHQIQFDHVKPWSFGGEHSKENIILTCGQHNRYRWNALRQS